MEKLVNLGYSESYIILRRMYSERKEFQSL